MSALPKYTIALDAADLDVLYTLVAGQEEGMRTAVRRMGYGVITRAFNNLHAQMPHGMPFPAEIRQALRDEGKWSVAPEPDNERSSNGR